MDTLLTGWPARTSRTAGPAEETAGACNTDRLFTLWCRTAVEYLETLRKENSYACYTQKLFTFWCRTVVEIQLTAKPRGWSNVGAEYQFLFKDHSEIGWGP